MRIDLPRLPIGELLIGFLLAATIATFVVAFALPQGGGETAETVAIAESPTPVATPIAGQTPSPGETPPAPPPPELVQRGQEIANVNGCFACHSTTGEIVVGPSWKGIFGKPVSLNDGTVVTVDEAYIRESILNPPAKVVEGFDALMPTFPSLSEEDIRALIAFIQSLK